MPSIEIVNEYEGCSASNLKTLYTQIGGLGFDRIISHGEVDRLVKNSIYVFCQSIEGAAFDTPERVIHEVKIPFVLTEQQKEFRTLPRGSGGAIKFMSAEGDKIGFYNGTSNILFICDILHIHGTKSRQAFKLVLDILDAYRSKTPDEFVAWQKRFEGAMVYDVILMGADPEQELADSAGEIISANTVFPNGQGTDRKLGHDGHARTCEMRPDPQDTPLKLTNEFEKLLGEIADSEGFISDGQIFVGGGKELQIGGHIHISGIEPSEGLVKAIRNYMAVPMHKSMGGARVGSEFADYDGGDRVRWNGDDHWEYRPLMAYHFDKKTTNAVHCTFYCILETFRRNKSILTDNPVRSDYKKLWGYSTYGDHIDNFVTSFVTGVTRMEGIDILPRWFPTRGKQARVTFTNSQTNCPDKSNVEKLLKILRAHPFREISKGCRVNIQLVNTSTVHYYGLSKSASTKFQKELDKKWWAADPSAEIANDSYGKRTWHFVFQLPATYVKSDERIAEIATLLTGAIQSSLV